MKKLKADKNGWYCGYWNDSPIQINFCARKSLYKNEALHFHKDFYEYYLVIKGWLVLEIEGKEHKLIKNNMIIVEPKEKHKVTRMGKYGCKYLSVKSKSYKGNKILV